MTLLFFSNKPSEFKLINEFLKILCYYSL